MQRNTTPAPTAGAAPMIRNWEVRRSGPSQTVTGEQNGTPARITGVHRVSRSAGANHGRTVALDEAGLILAYLD